MLLRTPKDSFLKSVIERSQVKDLSDSTTELRKRDIEHSTISSTNDVILPLKDVLGLVTLLANLENQVETNIKQTGHSTRTTFVTLEATNSESKASLTNLATERKNQISSSYLDAFMADQTRREDDERDGPRESITYEMDNVENDGTEKLPTDSVKSTVYHELTKINNPM